MPGTKDDAAKAAGAASAKERDELHRIVGRTVVDALAEARGLDPSKWAGGDPVLVASLARRLILQAADLGKAQATLKEARVATSQRAAVEDARRSIERHYREELAREVGQARREGRRLASENAALRSRLESAEARCAKALRVQEEMMRHAGRLAREDDLAALPSARRRHRLAWAQDLDVLGSRSRTLELTRRFPRAAMRVGMMPTLDHAPDPDPDYVAERWHLTRETLDAGEPGFLKGRKG